MSPNNSANRRYLLGSAHPARKAFDRSIRTEAPAKVEDELSLDSILIIGDEYEYPKEERVPAGFYLSKITDARVRIKDNGKKMLDVFYDIEGCDRRNDGKTFQIKQSYVDGSDHHRVFSNAMIRAGLKSRSGSSAIIGVTECIHLAYVSDRSEIGSIVERKPCDWEDANEADAVTENDPEHDDFLPDEDA